MWNVELHGVHHWKEDWGKVNSNIKNHDVFYASSVLLSSLISTWDHRKQGQESW